MVGPPGPCGCGCALTEATSYGFRVILFARVVLGEPLDPWQEFAVIHAGELLEDGRPRFRHVLILVARQNGKTHLLKVLALFWLFAERWPMVFGTSSNLEYAKESWASAVTTAESVPELAELLPANAVLKGNNDVHLKTLDRCKYKIGAANRRGGRSLSIDRLIQDELREHSDWTAWNAATNAMNARPFAQNFAISNMGDDTSVVLDQTRASALEFIATGEGDPRLGLLEWSAPEHADPLDLEALAQANPNLGHRLDPEALLGDARRAVKAGGEQLTGFRTEVMCIRVKHLNPAIDPAAWARCLDPGDMSALRTRLAGCIDVAPDGRHVTLVVAAVLPDGRVRLEVVAAWDSTEAARRDLPGLVARVKPLVLGWFPTGPAAELAAELADRRKQGRMNWPPAGVRVDEIRGEVVAVCMGFAGLVTAAQIAQSGDPLLDDHVTGVEKLPRGDGWVFSRKGGGHGDAAYAAAGAAHLARTMPTPVGKPRLITVSDDE